MGIEFLEKITGVFSLSLTEHVLFFLVHELCFLGLVYQKGGHYSLIPLARVQVWLYDLLKHSFLTPVEISR